MGRALKPPPQLGHTFCSELTQSAQNVHSNEQISASVDWGGRSAPQFSQQGRSSSMAMASGSQFYRLARAAGPMIGCCSLRFRRERQKQLAAEQIIGAVGVCRAAGDDVRVDDRRILV